MLNPDHPGATRHEAHGHNAENAGGCLFQERTTSHRNHQPDTHPSKAAINISHMTSPYGA